MPNLGQVRIEKRRLEEILAENRKKHKKEYLEAEDSYRKSVIEWYKDQTKKAKAKEDFATYYQDEQQPQDHTSEYDDVIEMLEYTMEEEIILSTQEFRQYIQDRWTWQQEFKMSASYYNTKVGKEGFPQ